MLTLKLQIYMTYTLNVSKYQYSNESNFGWLIIQLFFPP